MTDWLQTLGHAVNYKRVERLMRVMGLQAVRPGPHTSRPHPAHRRYPYLLRHLKVARPNQVWCGDITYVPMQRGLLYLMAIMDWFSRYVLAWELGNTLDVRVCVVALGRAFVSGRPEICHTDQGALFTSQEFLACVEGAGVRVSMDGRGRAQDNVFVERLWRSVKYEAIYLQDYADRVEAWAWLHQYVVSYNTERRHQNLGRGDEMRGGFNLRPKPVGPSLHSTDRNRRLHNRIGSSLYGMCPSQWPQIQPAPYTKVLVPSSPECFQCSLLLPAGGLWHRRAAQNVRPL